jgi:hypothetical protein
MHHLEFKSPVCYIASATDTEVKTRIWSTYDLHRDSVRTNLLGVHHCRTNSMPSTSSTHAPPPTHTHARTRAHTYKHTGLYNPAMKRTEGVHEALLLLFMQSAKLLGTVVRVVGGGYRM